VDRQPVLEGERLRMRPLTAQDWEALFAVASDRELWAGHPAHDRWQEPVFREYFGKALANGGALVVIDKASGDIVGASQFHDYQPDEDGRGPSVEIGFTFLARSHWGGAYNTEMKRLMLAHALGAVEYVRFRIGETNARSRRAMEKIGGRLTERRQSEIKAGQPSTNVIYEIDRAAFAAGPLAMDRQPTLEGERLLLRPLRPEDWDALYAVAADPLVWELHPASDRWREPVFRAFFDDALAQGGALVVVDKTSNSIAGSSRFQGYDPADGGSVEIGWTFLARSHWGGAYNGEMKRLMLGHALKSVARVYFRVGETNLRSRRAMEKIGGRLTGRTEQVESGGSLVTHVIYEIDRAGFAAGPLAC
jgi:RimJ/RimL family protein N-acetyltransferase